jgi:hypothetical protein
MSESPVTVKWVIYDGFSAPAKVVREQLGRALIPGYRWRSPVTGRFVRKTREEPRHDEA